MIIAGINIWSFPVRITHSFATWSSFLSKKTKSNPYRIPTGLELFIQVFSVIGILAYFPSIVEGRRLLVGHALYMELLCTVLACNMAHSSPSKPYSMGLFRTQWKKTTTNISWRRRRWTWEKRKWQTDRTHQVTMSARVTAMHPYPAGCRAYPRRQMSAESAGWEVSAEVWSMPHPHHADRPPEEQHSAKSHNPTIWVSAAEAILMEKKVATERREGITGPPES